MSASLPRIFLHFRKKLSHVQFVVPGQKRLFVLFVLILYGKKIRFVLWNIESYGEYKGTYHVLGGLIKPLEGIGPSQLSFAPLINRLKKSDVTEIIIATNPTVEGDTTALYLNKIILEAELPAPPKVTRLATGIPVGGDLEYIDKRTLSLSFRGRSQM